MIPSYSQLSIDVAVKSAIGYGIAAVSKTNQTLWVLTLATQSLGNYVLSRFIQTELNRPSTRPWSEAKIYEASRAISYTLAIVALKHLGLISLRVAGLFAFINFAVLCGRMKWLNERPVASFIS